MGNPHNIKKGQNVYIVSSRIGLPEAHKVAKVGRKFFYLEVPFGQGPKFDLEDLREVVTFGGSRQAYATLRDAQDSVDRAECLKTIRYVFADFRGRTERLSLDQLRRMVAILKEGE